MVEQGGSDPCPGHLASHSEKASDLGTEYNCQGDCNLLGSHLVKAGWDCGLMGCRRLIALSLARALHFHFAMKPVGKWATSKTMEVRRSL